MGRRRYGNFIFEWWISDHRPYHIHIYRVRGRQEIFLGRFNLEAMAPMDEGMRISKKLRKALDEFLLTRKKHGKK